MSDPPSTHPRPSDPPRLDALDAGTRRAIELEAERTIARRAIPGAVAGTVATIAFAFVVEAPPTFSRGSYAIAAAALVALALRLIALRSAHRVDPARAVERTWRWLRAATSTLVIGLFALQIARAMNLFGLTPMTCLMAIVQSSLVAAIAHGQAPNGRHLALNQTVVIGLPLLGIIASDAPGRWVMAALMGLHYAYAVSYGRRLGEEYWRAAVDRALLREQGEALRRLQHRARELVEKTPDAMGLVRDGTLVFVNAAWTSMIGLAPADVLGARLADLVAPSHREALGALLVGPAGPAALEVPMRLSGGAFATWELRVGEALDDAGASARPVVARDVTERNRLRARLQISERLTSLGTLAAGVAHEINNPLTYLMANVELARLELDGGAAVGAEASSAVLALLDDAYEGADRVRVIVRELRAFASEDEPAPGPVALADALDFAVKVTARTFYGRAALVRDLAADLPPVLALQGQLSQVFVNLLMNAAQATPEGEPDRHEVRVSARALDDGRVEVEVSDTGVGIAEADLARIFDPFFTTKPVGVGMGLGLSICHASMKSFGGDISVRSAPGRGTTFTLRLLACPAGVVQTSNDDAAA